MSFERQASHPIEPLFIQRWSPRAFTGEAIDETLLMSFFEAARWAPSAFNSQPWRFAWARRDTAGWSRIFNHLNPFNQGWAKQASALVVVLSNTKFVPPGQNEAKPLVSHAFDAGAAWAQMALQATQAGWSVHGMTGVDFEALRAALDVPADWHINAVIAVGKRGDKALLPEGLQAREQPSDRLPVQRIAPAVAAAGALKLD